MKVVWIRLALSASLVVAALSTVTPADAAPVTSDDLIKAQNNTAEWLMYGRDYRNWRYSPLDKVTPENAAQLKPVWAISTGGKFGGLEATPLYRDGTLYYSTD